MTPIKPIIVAGLHILATAATAASLLQESPTLAFDRAPILELQLPRINLQKGLRYVNRTLSVARLDALSSAADGAFWEHATSARLGFIHSRPAKAPRSIASTTRTIRPWTLNAADFARVEAVMTEGDDMEKWQLFSYLVEMQAQYAAAMEFGMRRLHRKIAEQHQKGVELHQAAIETNLRALRLKDTSSAYDWYTSFVAFLDQRFDAESVIRALICNTVLCVIELGAVLGIRTILPGLRRAAFQMVEALDSRLLSLLSTMAVPEELECVGQAHGMREHDDTGQTSDASSPKSRNRAHDITDASSKSSSAPNTVVENGLKGTIQFTPPTSGSISVFGTASLIDDISTPPSFASSSEPELLDHDQPSVVTVHSNILDKRDTLEKARRLGEWGPVDTDMLPSNNGCSANTSSSNMMSSGLSSLHDVLRDIPSLSVKTKAATITDSPAQISVAPLLVGKDTIHGVQLGLMSHTIRRGGKAEKKKKVTRAAQTVQEYVQDAVFRLQDGFTTAIIHHSTPDFAGIQTPGPNDASMAYKRAGTALRQTLQQMGWPAMVRDCLHLPQSVTSDLLDIAQHSPYGNLKAVGILKKLEFDVSHVLLNSVDPSMHLKSEELATVILARMRDYLLLPSHSDKGDEVQRKALLDYISKLRSLPCDDP